MEKKIKIIAPTKAEGTLGKALGSTSKTRVAAYCRVSTGSDEQATSFENQVEEWTKRITSNPDYELVEIYTDQGISGTSSKNRDGFNKMILDAKQGKIDLILCKSISRFARNTALSIQTIRDLKALGVGIKFDNESLYTLDPNTEFFLTIMSSMAQEESRHISENVRWTLRKKMQEGNPMVNTTRFLGYDKSEDGTHLVINQDEAKIVRLIYDMYDSGEGCYKIAVALQNAGYKTATGSPIWYSTTVLDILKNEKYAGDLLLQKTYISDFLNHSKKKNTGQVQQYYVENAHEAIISIEQWNRIQAKLQSSKTRCVGSNPDMAKYTNRYSLSGALVCANCGNTFKRRLWNSTTENRQFCYQCSTYANKLEYDYSCKSNPVSEALANMACCDVINNIFISKSKVFSKLSTLIKSTLSTEKIDADIAKKQQFKVIINHDIDELMSQRSALTSLELKEKIDKQYRQLLQQYERISNDIKMLEERRDVSLTSQDRLNKMLELLNAKKITPEILNSEMVNVFFYKIFVTDKNELVFVINATHSLSQDEVVERRASIIKQVPVYENQITACDPVKRKTIKFKVVLA